MIAHTFGVPLSPFQCDKTCERHFILFTTINCSIHAHLVPRTLLINQHRVAVIREIVNLIEHILEHRCRLLRALFGGLYFLFVH